MAVRWAWFGSEASGVRLLVVSSHGRSLAEARLAWPTAGTFSRLLSLTMTAMLTLLLCTPCLLLSQIGCGAPGLADGSYEEAAFHRPQGVAYSPKVGGAHT